MTDEYLKVLATSKSIEEFKFKMAIEFYVDVDEAEMKDFEDDYLSRISCNLLYVKRLVENGKVDLRRCFECNLPTLISDRNEIDDGTLIKMRVLRFYDRNGIERVVNYNNDLALDMEAMYPEVDINVAMMNMLELELMEYMK